MGKVEAYSRGRGSDVEHGDRALQFVVSRLVEEIAHSDHAHILTYEVNRQAG